MIYLSRIVLIISACVFTSQAYAFGEMTVDEVITLFSGKIVEGEVRRGGVPGVDEPNKVESFATPFSIYFGSDGTLKRKSGGKPKIGKWRVSGNAELCLNWKGKGKKEKCAPIHKQGNVYKRVVRRPNGFILFEQTYIGFAPGN